MSYADKYVDDARGMTLNELNNMAGILEDGAGKDKEKLKEHTLRLIEKMGVMAGEECETPAEFVHLMFMASCVFTSMALKNIDDVALMAEAEGCLEEE